MMISVLMKEETEATNTERPSTTKITSSPNPIACVKTWGVSASAVGIRAIAHAVVARPSRTAHALRRGRDSRPASGTVKLPRTGIRTVARTRNSQFISVLWFGDACKNVAFSETRTAYESAEANACQADED